MRDLVGYGPHPPHARWPGGARVAVQFAINYEEGSEYSVADGDERNEAGLADAIGGRLPAGRRAQAVESRYE
jgi:allantoinase